MRGMNPFIHHLNFENVEMEDGPFNDYYEYDRSYKLKWAARLTFRDEPVTHSKEEHYKMETPQFTHHGHPKPGILYNNLNRSYSASRAVELQ